MKKYKGSAAAHFELRRDVIRKVIMQMKKVVLVFACLTCASQVFGMGRGVRPFEVPRETGTSSVEQRVNETHEERIELLRLELEQQATVRIPASKDVK